MPRGIALVVAWTVVLLRPSPRSQQLRVPANVATNPRAQAILADGGERDYRGSALIGDSLRVYSSAIHVAPGSSRASSRRPTAPCP
jgi:hypothetical protein